MFVYGPVDQLVWLMIYKPRHAGSIPDGGCSLVFLGKHLKGELPRFSNWGQIQVPSINRRFKGTYVLYVTSSGQEKLQKKGACWVSDVDDVIGTKPRACHWVRYSCGRIRRHIRCSFMSGVQPYSFKPECGPTERDVNTVEDIDGHDDRQITGEDLSDENENRVGTLLGAAATGVL